MNYVLINLEIKKAKGARIKGVENAGEYLSAAAINPYDEFEPSHNVAVFDSNVVKKWKNRLPESKGGNLPDDDEWSEDQIPLEKRVWQGGIDVQYDLGGQFCRTYTNDIVDENGDVIPGKAAGDVICTKDGRPKVVERIMVFCKRSYRMEPVFDDDGMPVIKNGKPKMKPVRVNGQLVEDYVKGYDPDTLGANMRDLMIPYEKAIEKLREQGNYDEEDEVEEPDEPDVDEPDADEVEDEDENIDVNAG